MGAKYIHYTSRRFAQEIVIAGQLLPRSTIERIYLTQDVYSTGAEAAARLSILGKPVEVCCIIPEEEVEALLGNPGKPQHVEPAIGPNGLNLRPGCGDEYYTRPGVGITVKSDKVHWFSVPIP